SDGFGMQARYASIAPATSPAAAFSRASASARGTCPASSAVSFAAAPSGAAGAPAAAPADASVTCVTCSSGSDDIAESPSVPAVDDDSPDSIPFIDLLSPQRVVLRVSHSRYGTWPPVIGSTTTSGTSYGCSVTTRS